MTILQTAPAAPVAGTPPPAPSPAPLPPQPPTAPTPLGQPPVAGSWRQGLPEDIRNNPALAKFQDLNGLARGYMNAESMIGADKVVVPGRNATPEQVREFHRKLGAPDTAEGYTLPTDLPKEYVPAPDDAKVFFGIAHELGLTPAQVHRLVKWDSDRMKGAAESIVESGKQEKAEAEVTLRKEWGAAYDQNVTQAIEAVKNLGGDELVGLLVETGLGNSPPLVKAFAAMGKYLAQDKIISAGGRATFVMTPQEAQSAIGQKERDQDFMKALMKADHPGHKEAVAEMARLHELAHPQKEPELISFKPVV